MTPRSHGPWLDNLEPTPEPPMNPQTLRNHAPILDALQQLTAMAPGLPVGTISIYRYAEDGYKSETIDVTARSLDDLLLWGSAIGGHRTDLPVDMGDTSRYLQVSALVQGVHVKVTYAQPISGVTK